MALSLTPSRIGIFTPQIRSTPFSSVADFAGACAIKAETRNAEQLIAITKRRTTILILISFISTHPGITLETQFLKLKIKHYLGVIA